MDHSRTEETRPTPHGEGSRTTANLRPDPVEQLLAECLARAEDEQVDALKQACDAHPDLAQELRERWQLLARTGLATATSTANAFPDQLGEFRLLRFLGGGGMGVVYLAEQESLGREVALKLIRPEHLYFPGARERFHREVEVIARLRHPGIVPVYTVGEQDGIPYFTMERLTGCTLAAVLQSLHGRDPETLGGADLAATVRELAGEKVRDDAPIFQGSWVAAALEACRQIAEALDHAHGRGVVHRDVKPSNIMLTAEGRVMLFDFGLTASTQSQRLTRSGSQLGTLLYMSPEQVKGETEVDARSDIYSLGVTLYEMLALQAPYLADDSVQTQQLILAGTAPSLRSRNRRVDADVETVCLCAMAPDRGRRYDTVAGFARDIENAGALRPIEARPPGPLQRTRRWIQRNPAWSLSLALALLLALGGPLFFAWQQWLHAAELSSNLSQIRRLSDRHRVRLLDAEAATLYPSVPEMVPAMDDWIDRATQLHDRLPLHRETADLLRGRVRADSSAADESGSLAEQADVWQLALLEELIPELESLAMLTQAVAKRRDFADAIDERSITSPEASRAWREAAAGIATSSRYAQLSISPQIGLLPLGPDPETGLWEFWLIESGQRPERDGATGRWEIGPQTGMVFVLLPGATTNIGSRRPSRRRPQGPYVDPGHLPNEPLRRVEVEPCFVSKYEMTNGQWERATGAMPDISMSLQPDVLRGLPVGGLSWGDANRTARQLGLRLPTEIEWEYACRAGSTTVWSFGHEPQEMSSYGNVASRDGLKADTGALGQAIQKLTSVEEWSDGHEIVAPVGSYLPNDFGLHDMHGNHMEWCSDRIDSFQIGQEATEQEGIRPIIRGGSYEHLAAVARSAFRALTSPESRSTHFGVRLSRSVQQRP